MTIPNFVLVDQSFSKKTGQLPLDLSIYSLPTTVTTGTYIADILNVRKGLVPTVEPFWNYTVGGSELTGWTLLVGPIPPTIPSTLRIIAGGQVARYALFPNVVSTLGTLTLSGALNNGTATSGAIIGATPGSPIVSNVTGLTVDSINRTYSFNGSASASTVANGLVETLSGAIGSPKNSSITVGAAIVTLGTLAFASLPNPLYTGSSASGTITGATTSSTITASGLPSGFTINGAARTWAWSGSGSAAISSVSLTEALAGAVNTPNVTSGLSITVAVPAVTLVTLALSSTTFTVGTSSSGTIAGATVGSTIAGTSLPSGFTINGAARTWAWDGTGSVSSPTITLTETLAGATNTPHATNIGLTIVAAATITAPVITRTSTAGGNPYLWTTAENATFFPGYYWNVQTATGADTTAAASNLAAGTTTCDIIQQIEPGDLSGTPVITFAGLTATSVDGPFAIRERVGVEDGAGGYNWGPWSNVLTDTLATPSTPSAWVPTTGVGKSQYVTVSGSNLIATGQGGFSGAPISVRADQLRTGKKQFQTTLGTAPYGIWIGVDDGTTNFNSGFARPGKDNSAGISLTANSFGWEIWVSGGMVQSGGTGSSVILASDILTCTFDTAGGTVSFYITRSGTTTQLGTAQAVTMALWYANVGFENGTSQTALFASGQARTLDSGYSYYG